MASTNIYSENVQRNLKAVIDECQKEDTAIRERQLRNARRLKLLWDGFSRVWYSETAHDWRIWDETSMGSDSDQASYDKPINVFRAYLESIYAALSVSIPPIKCYPDDADDTLDLSTARAGDKIAQLIYRHNDVALLWLHSLFVYGTEGMTAWYNYAKKSEEYGTYTQQETEEVPETVITKSCPNCGNQFEDNEDEGEFDPSITDESITGEYCPNCQQEVQPNVQTETFTITRIVGETKQPKSRICLEVYGLLNVQIPNYARNQRECPYLIYSYETHFGNAIQEYEHLTRNKELIQGLKGGNNAGSYEEYAQWARLSPQYGGEYPQNVVTKQQSWLRHSAFNVLDDDDDIAELKRLFPNGAKVTFINDSFAEACDESLDDHWTINQNPMSDFVQYEPLGNLLVNVQEITNDMLSLVLQTIEHGIGMTFADPAVLNFKAFETEEVTPGAVFPATPKSGKSLSDAFFELRTATLSAEVLPFSNQIQSLGQLVSGALPSLFGGTIEGSETASQYSMSRAQALQRLQNTWKMLTTSWKIVFSKAVPMYIKEIKEDERDVQKDKDGNFINVFIRKAELEGRIGKVELEANENLPMTWSQKKDLMMNLLQNANPEVMKIINAPENLPQLHEAIGLVDFFVPGEQDVIKQYDEIKILLNSEPIETGNPMEPEESSVPIDSMYDNNPVEFEICRKWIISEAGRQAKLDNPAGYKNVLLHGRAHFLQIQAMQQQAMMSQAGQPGGGAPPEKPIPNNEAPITGEGDVPTT